MSKSIKTITETSGVKAQDVEYLASDIVVDDAATLRVNLAGTAVDVEMTRDGGATWKTLVTALTADKDTTIKTGVRVGDIINFRTNNASGITLAYFRVDSLTTSF